MLGARRQRLHRQQQRRRARGRRRGGRAHGHGHDPVGRPQRHRAAQHVLRTTARGASSFVPYPDDNPPSLGQTCAGTGGHEVSGLGCVYDPQGDALVGNTFKHNGYFGNPTNSDFGELTLNNARRELLLEERRARRLASPRTSRRPRRPARARWRSATPSAPAARCTPRRSATPGFGSCPAGAQLPEARGGGAARGADAALHAEPVQGRAVERVVQGRQAHLARRAASAVGRPAGRDPVAPRGSASSGAGSTSPRATTSCSTCCSAGSAPRSRRRPRATDRAARA